MSYVFILKRKLQKKQSLKQIDKIKYKIRKMKITKFIEKFTEQIDDLDVNSIKIDTVFRDLDDWSSLTALSIIAMVDEEFDVIINGRDIRKCITLQDLFDLIESKK